MTQRYVLSLGGNETDPISTIDAAVRQIDEAGGVTVKEISRAWLSSPWGPVRQSWFVNKVVLADSHLTPREMLALAKSIELNLGRERSARWGPRAIDIDLISTDGPAVDDTDLALPHRYAHERTFVLAPWHELEPEAELAGHGKITDLLSRLLQNNDTSTCVPYSPQRLAR